MQRRSNVWLRVLHRIYYPRTENLLWLVGWYKQRALVGKSTQRRRRRRTGPFGGCKTPSVEVRNDDWIRAGRTRTEKRRETYRTGATNQRHVTQARSTSTDASGTDSGSNSAPSSNESVLGNL